MLIRNKKRNNNRRLLIAVITAIIAPWLVVAAVKGLQLGFGFIEGLAAWQQTAVWVSLVGIVAIIAGYLLFKALRRLAVHRLHGAKDRPRQLGVRFYGGGFADVLDRINTDAELKFKAAGWAAIPRSIKGDAVISICEEPFPCTGFPVREAVRTFSGAAAQRRVEEPGAIAAYSDWASRHRGIVALLDIVGKGEGYTGISCLHSWRWLAKPDVFRFLLVVFDPEEAKTEEEPGNDASNTEIEKEVEACVS